LKTKGNTPKYGLIYHSTFIGRADSKNKGRISRYLANKCSIATRIDSFSDDPTRIYGEKLREQVEERLKFYETGQSPRRNIDVMEEVSKQLKAGSTPVKKMDIDDDDDDDEPKSDKKKKSKKDKKRKSDAMDVEETPKKEEEKTPKKKVKDDDDDEEVEKSSKKAKKEEKKKKKDKKKSM
jgi:nucleolar protein 56